MENIGVGLAEALVDLISTMMAGMLSKDGGSVLNIASASWTCSSLISEVTIGALDVDVKEKSYVAMTSSVGGTTRVSSPEAAVEPALASVLMIKSVV